MESKHRHFNPGWPHLETHFLTLKNYSHPNWDHTLKTHSNRNRNGINHANFQLGAALKHIHVKINGRGKDGPLFFFGTTVCSLQRRLRIWGTGHEVTRTLPSEGVLWPIGRTLTRWIGIPMIRIFSSNTLMQFFTLMCLE